MNRALIALIFVAISLGVSCGRRQAAPANTNRNSNSTARTSSNVNATSQSQPPSQPGATANPAETSAPKLAGTYEVSEVQKGGVINILTTSKTRITFMTDGTYQRTSQAQGKIEHTDVGDFRIDGDKLVLMIKLSQGQIQLPPREVTHTFSLSENGDELKLTSTRGATAVFHRTRQAPPK